MDSALVFLQKFRDSGYVFDGPRIVVVVTKSIDEAEDVIDALGESFQGFRLRGFNNVVFLESNTI